MATDEENSIDMLVGRRVRDRRVELGLSQSQLARAIGITFQQVQKYERGTNRISASKLWMIGRCLGITPAALLSDLPGLDHTASAQVTDEDALERAQLLAAFSRILEPRRRRTVIEVAEGLAESRPKRRAGGR
jgi:transcriptional regulator with XRE-family HTH domain